METPPPRPRNTTPPRPGEPPERASTSGAGRACGSCDLCCRLPSIDWPEFPELHKPADVHCRHLAAGVGCRIHAERPVHCASFQCLWLMGFGPDELRPDRIGGFFDAVDSGSLFLLTDKQVPDPRTIPAVARFIDDWRARRRAKLVVYREGREVKEPRGRVGGGGGGGGGRGNGPQSGGADGRGRARGTDRPSFDG